MENFWSVFVKVSAKMETPRRHRLSKPLTFPKLTPCQTVKALILRIEGFSHKALFFERVQDVNFAVGADYAEV